MGIVEPVLLLLNCDTVLRGCGQNEEAGNVLRQAEAWVETIASRISDEAVRDAFLYKRQDVGRLKALSAAQ